MIEKKQYIWEYFIDGEDVEFEQAYEWNPYGEIVTIKSEPEGHTCCVYNALDRHQDFFKYYFEKYGIPKNSFQKVVFDACTHMIAFADSQKGLTDKEYSKKKIVDDIQQKLYGEGVADVFSSLTSREKYIVAHYVYFQNQENYYRECALTQIYFFSNALFELIGAGALYRNNINGVKYVLYIGEKKNEITKAKLFLVKTLFWPLEYDLDVIWEKHFGMIGEEETMRVNNICIL